MICKGAISLQGFPVSKALFPRPNFQAPISKAQYPWINLQVPNFKPLHLRFAAKLQRQLRLYLLNQTYQEKAVQNQNPWCPALWQLWWVSLQSYSITINITFAWGVQGVSPWLFYLSPASNYKTTPLLSFSLVREKGTHLKDPFIQLVMTCAFFEFLLYHSLLFFTYYPFPSLKRWKCRARL